VVVQEVKEIEPCRLSTVTRLIQHIIKEAWVHHRIEIAHIIALIASQLKKGGGKY